MQVYDGIGLGTDRVRQRGTADTQKDFLFLTIRDKVVSRFAAQEQEISDLGRQK
jgi:hypothetical protein